MRLPRTLAIVGATTIAGIGIGSAASATSSISPSSGLHDNDPVTVNFSGLPPNDVVYLMQCIKDDSDPTFNYLNDCSPIHGVNPSTGNGTGSAVFNVFDGEDDPDNPHWACSATTDPNLPPAKTKATCFIRLAPQVQANTTSDEFHPFTLVAGGEPSTTTTTVVPPSSVPEAPVSAALAVSAAAVLGGGIFLVRRRAGRAA